MLSMLVLSPTMVATTTDVKATAIENVRYEEMKVTDIDEKTQILTTASVKKIVSEYFADVPVMANVAFCESSYKQFNEDGTVMRGWMTPEDVGVMQINEGYHGERAKKAGIDLHTIEGNMKFARLLYNESGTKPWSASKSCWSKM